MSASPPAPVTPSIVFGSHTDVGKRRANNEDASRCGRLGAGTLLVVCDGVGGLKGGEIASRLAVDHLHTELGERLARAAPPADRRGWIEAALRATDRRVRAAAEQPGLAGMGATASLLWIEGRGAWWGQAGDSRTYLFRGHVLRQLSLDQSPVGRLRAEGNLTEKDARQHPLRHLIDQCLGGSGGALDPQTGTLDLAVGDVFLLCSDGLSDGLWDREIADVLESAAAGQAPEEVARTLVNRANAASGKDNITAIVARVERIPRPERPSAAGSGWGRLLGRRGFEGRPKPGPGRAETP